jgi:hypothetical protein
MRKGKGRIRHSRFTFDRLLEGREGGRIFVTCILVVVERAFGEPRHDQVFTPCASHLFSFRSSLMATISALLISNSLAASHDNESMKDHRCYGLGDRVSLVFLRLSNLSFAPVP